MKVIAKIDDNTVICEIKKDEIARVFNFHSIYYANRDGNKIQINVGDTIDLGAGYNFAEKIKSTCSAMLKAMEEFNGAKTTLTSFAELFVKKDEEVKP